MKAMKTPKKKSLLKKTGARADSPSMGRAYYRDMFNRLVKGGMDKKSAARRVQKEAADDIRVELDEFFLGDVQFK
jgi:hypothetical protein